MQNDKIEGEVIKQKVTLKYKEEQEKDSHRRKELRDLQIQINKDNELKKEYDLKEEQKRQKEYENEKQWLKKKEEIDRIKEI